MGWKVDSGSFAEGIEPDPFCKVINGREGPDVLCRKVDTTGTFGGGILPGKVNGRERPRVVGWNVGTGRFVEEIELDPLCNADGRETGYGVVG